MKTWCVLAVVILGLWSTAEAKGGEAPLDGHYLLRACTAWLKTLQAARQRDQSLYSRPLPQVVDEADQAGYCTGAVHSLIKVSANLTLPDGERICTPNGLTLEHAVPVVRRYLMSTQHALHYSGPELIAWALYHAYPCAPGQMPGPPASVSPTPTPAPSPAPVRQRR